MVVSSRNRLPEGMVLRGRTYYARFRCDGRRIRKKLSKNLRTATQLLIELRARAQRSDFGLVDNRHPVDRLKALFLKHCRQTLKRSTVDRYDQCFLQLMPHLPARVSQVNAGTMLAYRQQRLAAGVSPETVNKEVKVLGTMFKWAASEAVRLIGSNAIAGIKRLPNDRPKDGRALEADEVDRLLAKSPARYRDVWYCFLTTGLRKMELAWLRFDDIDWEGRELTVRRAVSKTHRARCVPIDDRLLAIFQGALDEAPHRQPVRNGGKQGDTLRRLFSREHVFVTRFNTPFTEPALLYCALMRHCKAAGIETRRVDLGGREIDHVDVHSLRRTFATELIVNGTDPKTVQELLGHKSLAMTMNLYAKVHRGTKRQALSRLPWGSGASGPEHVVPLAHARGGPKADPSPNVAAQRAVG